MNHQQMKVLIKKQKTNIYQLKLKTSPNIIIINNKILSTHIPSIPVDKQNLDFKNDILIKEIIGTDDLLQENNNSKFKSLYDLANNKSEIELKNFIIIILLQKMIKTE